VTFNAVPATWKAANPPPGNSINNLRNGSVTYATPITDPIFNASFDPNDPTSEVQGGSYGYFAGVTGLNWSADSPGNFSYSNSNSGNFTSIPANFVTSSFSFAGDPSTCGVCGLTFVPSFTEPQTGTITNGNGPTGNTSILGTQGPTTLTYLALLNGNPTGQTISLTYNARFLVSNNDRTQASGFGSIVFQSNTVPTNKVPSPLPILGASAAFAYSRRIRRRLQVQLSTKAMI
jgi:hypothetical protein